MNRPRGAAQQAVHLRVAVEPLLDEVPQLLRHHRVQPQVAVDLHVLEEHMPAADVEVQVLRGGGCE